MDWIQWIGKKIFVRLDSGSYFNGIVENVEYIGKNNFNVDLYMFTIIDKFGLIVCFRNNEIKSIKEEQ